MLFCSGRLAPVLLWCRQILVFHLDRCQQVLLCQCQKNWCYIQIGSCHGLVIMLCSWLYVIGVNFNTLRLRGNGRHFPDDIFKWISLYENVWISIKIPLNFIPKGLINNSPALVLIMAWHWPGDKLFNHLNQWWLAVFQITASPSAWVCPKQQITLEEDRELFLRFSSILCLWFEIQGRRTDNFFDSVLNTVVSLLAHIWVTRPQ